LFGHHPDGLDIFYGDNVFGHTTLRKEFLVPYLDDCYNNSFSTFASNFDANCRLVNWHARLGHISQVTLSGLAKEGLLDQLTKVKFSRCKSCLVRKATTKPFG